MFTAYSITLIIVALFVIILSMFETDAFNVEFISFGQTRIIRLKYVICAILFTVFGICIKNSYDIGNYRWAYEQRLSHGKEPLFDTIRFFLRDRGVSFETFRILWILVVALLLYIGIRKYCKVPEQVVALTLVLVLFSFITQMRSALTFAVILNAFSLLFTGRRTDKLLYALIVILCGQIHIVSYVFLLFLIVRADGSRSYKGKYFVIVGLFTFVSLLMNTFMVDIVSAVLGFIPGGESIARRIISNISGVGAPIKSAIFNICKQLVLFILTDRACAMLIEEAPVGKKSMYRVISEINTLSLVFIPICIVNEAFMRLFNPIAILQYSMILNVGHNRTEITKNLGFDVTMKTTIVCFTLFVLFMSIRGNPDDFVIIMSSIRW